MSDHGRYEELTALAAGGHLSPEENDELRAHVAVCSECRMNARTYRDLVCAGLPLTRDAAAAARERETAATAAGARERFLARARRAGVRLSPELDGHGSAAESAAAPSRSSVGYRVAAGLAFAAVLLIAAAVYVPQLRRSLSPEAGADQAVARLPSENAELAERLAARDQEFAGQQEQIRKLRADLDAAIRNANELRRENQLQGVRLGRSTSQSAALVDELQNREQQLASASDELRRINQLRVTDRAALDAQGVRLRDIHNQLRIATATLEMERQLAATGKDLLKLILAKQLRVVDVRDTDVNGRPSPAFARVFIADGQTIRIFAFDLNEGQGATRRFQVWGEQLGQTNSVRSLGTLDVDDRPQNRWSLTIQNADVVKDINSVFVTTAARSGAPDSPRLLYAYIGGAALP